MKLLESLIIKEFRRSVQQAQELLLSFGLSLFIHILLLIGVTWSINSRELYPRLSLQSVVFDFAMSHADASSQSVTEKRPRRQSQRSLSHTSPASESPSIRQEGMQHSIGTEAPVTPNLPTPGLDDATESGAKLFETETTPFSPTTEPVRPLPNTANLTPKLLPHKFAMPSPQRKAILKKVTEVIAKTITKTKLDSAFLWEKNGQQFHFKLSHLPASSATGFDELLVGVTTVDGDDTLSTQLRLRRTAFSHFAQFVDYWDPRVALHDDEFDGRFHSNGAMVVSSSNGTQPRFRGKVTTAAYSIRNSDQRSYLDDSKVFLAGLEEGAATIPLPRVFMGIPRDTSHSAGHVNLLSEESWITFYEDGAYSWHTASLPRTEYYGKISHAPHTIIGQGKARLHVKGIINGMALIYSENDIIIDDDLLYAHNPEAFSNSADFLGLVSAKDIEVAPPAITGPGDLKIYAAIFAKGHFRVPNLYTRETGTLHIYGSLSAGSITATEPRYATRVRFDKRFEKMRPPNFPMTNQYEIAEWDERWMVK